MRKAYVILRCEGQHGDCSETPVRVYLDEERAEAMLAKLRKIANSIDARVKALDAPFATWDGNMTNKRRVMLQAAAEEIAAEYRALGFIADFESHWDIIESEMDDG
jgi:uncharacterized protein YfcZ (UPF0381/DUF406 family)